MASRVTLRRAAYLASRLTAERRAAVAALGALGVGSGGEAKARRELESRIAVLNKQLATTVDVMVMLKSSVSGAEEVAAGAGGYQRSYITLTRGIGDEGNASVEAITDQFGAISDRTGELLPENAFAQSAIGLGLL